MKRQDGRPCEHRVKIKFPRSDPIDFHRRSWDPYRAFLHRIQTMTHRLLLFPENRALRLRDDGAYWLALAWLDGQVVGVMAYRTDGMYGQCIVHDLLFSDSGGKYLLLQWLALHAGQFNPVRMRLPPAHHPEMWLADLDGDLRV